MDYLCVTGATTPRGRHQAARLLEASVEQGFSNRPFGAAGWLATGGPTPPGLLRVGAWWLIGDIHNRRRTALSDVRPPDGGLAFEHSIIRRFWGRFIGLRLDRKGVPTELLRDPSGALECIGWRWEGLTIVASDLPAWLIEITRPDWRIALDRVAAALQDPLNSWADALIEGPTVVPPGSFQSLESSAPPIPLWRPDIFARAADKPFISKEDAGPTLRSAIEEAVASLSRGGALAAELSGGLDSSIVGSSLVAGDRDVRLWLHAFNDEPGADERPYARDMAVKLKINLTEVARSTAPLTEKMFWGLTPGIRPGFNGADMPNDREWARRLKQAGASVLMTGKGGDAVLVQSAGADVFSDIWRNRGWRAALSPALPALARWNNASVWSLLAAARSDRFRRDDQLGRSISYLRQDVRRPPHPWLAAASDLGPAKRYQIAGILNGITFSSPSLQSRAVELVHPLLAQPVVETCLALSSEQLTFGRRDRALARETFRDRLTPEIADRRSKGEMTAYYGRRLAQSLKVVRPWLLDGRLASAGLIDCKRLETMLTEDSLIWQGRVGEIMTGVVMEAWIRTWEARLNLRA
ncbi:asparagine synthase C-terminal domain-containing protein [Brevundimonas diminuta]|uniref:asparagine synthase C-terminal domain-containing protein n=1 Tax=Brevundimonas diminuta TaxID=293 RepID=UPI0030F55996